MSGTDKPSSILIVEDDEDTAALLVLQLQPQGYVFQVARNGQEAILKTGEVPPDLVIMDLMMPKLDGFETTRFLKSKFQDRFVPILVLTAKDDAQSRNRGARFGCDEYLTKPYGRQALVVAVRELLDLAKLEATHDLLQTTTPDPDDQGSVDALAARRHEVMTKLVEARLTLAGRQFAAGRAELARPHVVRAVELDQSNEEAQRLLRQLGD